MLVCLTTGTHQLSRQCRRARYKCGKANACALPAGERVQSARELGSSLRGSVRMDGFTPFTPALTRGAT
jgi:hypothetical protein